MRFLTYPFAIFALLLTSFSSKSAETPTTDLSRFGFGFGIGATFLNEREVLETSVSNGIVRITDSERVKKDAWLESHYLFDKYTPATWQYSSWGPFVALQVAGSEGVFSGLSGGLIWSWKRQPKSNKEDKGAFNVGIGYATRKIKVLGDGMLENQPLPTGEESVRTKKIDENGLMIIFSFAVF